MSEQERSEAAEIHRCRKCGTLWRRWPDGNYSLIENTPAGSCCDNAPMGAQIEQLWPPTVNLRIAYLEGTVIPHARKQEHANGFQAGWHAAIDRVQSGDKPDELKDLIPDSRAEQQPIGREKEPHCDDCDNPATLCICAFQRMSEEAARINTQTSASEPNTDHSTTTQEGVTAGETALRALASEFVRYWTTDRSPDGCGMCGGIPHSTTCYVGRMAKLIGSGTE